MIRSLLSRCCTGAAIGIVMGMGPTYSARPLIYLDLAGTLPGSPATSTWNQLTSHIPEAVGSSVADLQATDGSLTGLSVAVTDRFSGTTTGGGDWGASPVPWAVNDATSDGFWQTGGTGSLTFTGLAESLYNVSLISSRSSDGDRRGDFLVNGNVPDNHNGPFDAFVNGFTNHSVLRWSGVAPDAQGQWTLSVRAITSQQFAYLNAIAIQEIPEPGSLAMLACGALLITLRGRRQ